MTSSKSAKISLNVIFHVTILFTILSWFFMLFITNTTTKFINKELAHIIKLNFEKIAYNSNGMPKLPNISDDQLIKTVNSDIVKNIIDLIQTEINNLINNNTTIQNLMATNADLKNQLSKSTNPLEEDNLKKNIVRINLKINENIKNIINKFDYDYYIKVFTQEENTRTLINKNLFDNIIIVNALFFVFLLFYIFISINTKILNWSDVIDVLTENVITFILVGAIEFWFFLNVAFKFIPSPPSTIYISFVNSLKDYLGKFI